MVVTGERDRVSTSEAKLKCALLSARVEALLPSAKGSDDAAARIVETSELQHQFGGRLLEEEEGGVIYRFPSADNAVAAGLNLLARGSAFAVLRGGQTEMRVVVTYGDLADAGGRVDAAALEEAQQLVELSSPGQLTLTEPAVSALAPGLQGLAARRDEDGDGGRPGPALWVIAEPRAAAALISGPEDLLHLEPLKLNVRYRGEEWEVTAAWPVLLLGRSPNADITIDDNVVSRSHARIEYRLGRFLLIDHSRNGTFVRRPSGKEVFLRQQELSLSGQGVIGLGLPVSSSADRVIEFSVTRRSLAQA